MMKDFLKYKQRLLDLSEGINSFASDSVQVKVISWLFDHPDVLFKESIVVSPAVHVESPEQISGPTLPALRKSTGQVLNQMLKTEFFNSPQTLTGITNFCNEHYTGIFYPNGVSAVLLTLTGRGKLIRKKDEALKRFVYEKTVIG